MNKKKRKSKYISLKQAAEISGYSSDYIGFLIRKKKIKGRKFFLKSSWKITPKEIIRYCQKTKNLATRDSFLLKKRYLLLKEAAEISGYVPDYIGYLIRKGKLKGRKIYSGISLQTTKKAVMEYKNRKKYLISRIKHRAKIRKPSVVLLSKDYLKNLREYSKKILEINCYKNKIKNVNIFGYAWRFGLAAFIVLFLISGFAPIKFLQGSLITAITGGEIKTINFYSTVSNGGWQGSQNVQGGPDVLPEGDIYNFSEANSAVYKTGAITLICEDFISEELGEEQVETLEQEIGDSIIETDTPALPAEAPAGAEEGDEEATTTDEPADAEAMAGEEATTTEPADAEAMAGEEATTTTTEAVATTTEEVIKEVDEIDEPISFLKKIKNVFGSIKLVRAQEDKIFQSAKIKFSFAFGEKEQDILLEPEPVSFWDLPATIFTESKIWAGKIKNLFENLVDTTIYMVRAEENNIELPQDSIIKTDTESINDAVEIKAEVLSNIDDKIIIWYSLDGENPEGEPLAPYGAGWQKLGAISEYPLSNKLNGGYFEYEALFLKKEEDIKNLKIKFEGVVGGETNITAYLDSVWVEASYTKEHETDTETEHETDTKSELEFISRKNDFQLSEEPQLRFRYKKDKRNFLASVGEALNLVDYWNNINIEAKIKNPKGELIDISPDFIFENNGEFSVKMSPRFFQNTGGEPGSYKIILTIKDDSEIIFEQEFSWGVLALNVNKSIYLSGEQAYLQMGVLDEQGHTICGADLKLEITSPDGSVSVFETGDFEPAGLVLPEADFVEPEAETPQIKFEPFFKKTEPVEILEQEIGESIIGTDTPEQDEITMTNDDDDDDDDDNDNDDVEVEAEVEEIEATTTEATTTEPAETRHNFEDVGGNQAGEEEIEEVDEVDETSWINELFGISSVNAETINQAGIIYRSSECGPQTVTNIPDYYAYYNVSETGTYNLNLTAVTENGAYSITDSFEVQESVPFEVERIGPTRIYPLAPYDVVLKIKANQDFQGEIIEKVPESFEIQIQDTKYKIQDTGDGERTLIWQDVVLQEGDQIELSYTFDAPDISPYLYLLGPLNFEQQENKGEGIIEAAEQEIEGIVEKVKDAAGLNHETNTKEEHETEARPASDIVFVEARQWQIASDASETGIVRPDGDKGVNWSTQGTSDESCGGGTHCDFVDEAITEGTNGDGIYVYTITDSATETFTMGTISEAATTTDIDVHLYAQCNDVSQKHIDVQLRWDSSDQGSAQEISLASDSVWQWASTTFSGLSLNETQLGTLEIKLIGIKDGGPPNSDTVYTDTVYATIHYETAPPPAPALHQNHFRWRDDTIGLNTSSTESWLADEDASTSVAVDTVTRLRVEIADTGTGAATNYQYQLEYAAKNGTCAASDFTAVPTTTDSNPVIMASSSQYANNDTTTQGFLTTTSTAPTRADGYGIEDPYNMTPAHSLTNAYYTEFEYAIKLTSNATTTYCFRLTNNSATSTFTYDKYPELATPNITVSGTVYQTEGGSDIGSGASIKLKVDGGGDWSASTTAGGVYEITSITGVSAGSTITAWIDGDPTYKGTAVTIANASTSDITGFNIYGGVIIARSDKTSTALTIADMVDYDKDNDSDIHFTATTSPSASLTVDNDSELHIWDGKEFAPGGDITLSYGGAKGDLHIDGSAIFTGSTTSTYSIGGSWTASSTAVFTAASSTVTFTATTTGKTITTEGSDFYDLTFNGTGGGWTFQDNATTSNNFTISNGTVTGPSSGILAVGNNWSNTTGAFTHNNSTVRFYATDLSNNITSNNSSFYNLIFNGSNGGWTFQDAATTTNDLTITAGTLDLNGQNLGVQGGDISIAGTLSAGVDSGTVSLSGEGNLGGSGTTTVYDISFSGTTTLAGHITTNNDLTISVSNSLDASSSDIIVGGNWSNTSGTFTAQERTVTFNADSGSKTIDAGSSSFYNLTFNNASGGWTISGTNATTSNNFTITNGAVTSTSAVLYVGGNWLVESGGTFNHNNAKVLFNANLTDKTINPGSSSFYDLEFDNSNGGWTFSVAATTTNDFTITAGAVTSTSATLAIGGSWSNTGGTFNHNSGTVLFNSGSSETITDGGSAFHLLNFNGAGSWLYTNGTSTAPATTTVDNGTPTFLNAKTGNVSVNGGTLNVDWYLGIHIVDKDDTADDINTAGDNDATTSEKSGIPASTIWRYNGGWGSASTTQTTGTDNSGINPQPTDTGAIRLREYSRTSATTTYYYYNLEISSQGGFDPYNYYTDYGTKYLTSTGNSGSSHNKCISDSWHRPNAGTMNGSKEYDGVNQPPTQGSWYAGMSSDLEFSVSSTSTDLGDLSGLNDYTATGTTILYATTSYSGGYNITAWASNNGRLKLDGVDTYIARWDYANSTPAVWGDTCIASSTCCGFGYTTSDNNLGGGGDVDRFANSTKYAGFATTTPGDRVADATTTVSGATTTIMYRTSVSNFQDSGNYSTDVFYICTVNP